MCGIDEIDCFLTNNSDLVYIIKAKLRFVTTMNYHNFVTKNNRILRLSKTQVAILGHDKDTKNPQSIQRNRERCNENYSILNK
jgi:hypothetical protein